MQLGYQYYRWPLKAKELIPAARDFLAGATSESQLASMLAWEQPNDLAFIKKAFPATSNAREFLSLMKSLHQHHHLRSKRISLGHPDLLIPRKGFWAWWHKGTDKKELALPSDYEAFDWLHHCQRLILLISIHDALIGSVTSGDPKLVDFDEITALPNPLAEMVGKANLEQAKKLVANLSCPLIKVDPAWLCETLSGYVIYQSARGFAYYYCSNT